VQPVAFIHCGIAVFTSRLLYNVLGCLCWWKGVNAYEAVNGREIFFYNAIVEMLLAALFMQQKDVA